MTGQNPNTALYAKMHSEQEAYVAYLLTLPPREILNHSYEYTMREDILISLENNELPESHAKALLRSPSPLADAYRAWSKRDCTYMEDIWDSVSSFAQDRAEQNKSKHQMER